MRKLILASASFLMMAGAASAQSMPALINVNLENIRIDIARQMNIELEAVPINIQLPVEVAANVCGVDVGALGVDANTCTATNSTLAMQYVTNNIDTTATSSTDADAGADTELRPGDPAQAIPEAEADIEAEGTVDTAPAN